MFRIQRGIVSAGLAAALLGIGPAAGPARAGCNEIPPETVSTWRGHRGTVDTVFGRGDAPNPPPIPDPRNVEVGSNLCTPTQIAGNDYVVVIVFTPPRGGARNLVALTAQDDCSPISPKDCQQENVHCVCGADANILVSETRNTLRFRFPDTDGLYPPAGDGLSFTGPATIAVIPYGKGFVLPWQLTTQRCKDAVGTASFFACVDEIYDVGSCGTGRGDLDPTFAHFTALPPMNDWQKVCTKSGLPWPFDDPDPKCKNEDVDILFTVDEAGNVALPVSWANVLENQPGGGKKNREVEGGTDIARTKGGSQEIRIPSEEFLASFTPTGAGWPGNVVFEPGSQNGWLVLSGESDVPESVLRISRRELWGWQCSGGDNDGQACHPTEATSCPGSGAACVERAEPAYFACENGSEAGSYCTRSSDCPGGQCTPGSACVAISGSPAPPPPPPKSSPPCFTDQSCTADQECGLGLFEFRDQLLGGVGPVDIPKAKYKARAKKYK